MEPSFVQELQEFLSNCEPELNTAQVDESSTAQAQEENQGAAGAPPTAARNQERLAQAEAPAAACGLAIWN